MPASVLSERPGLSSYEGSRLLVGVRPEDIEDADLVEDGADGRIIAATLDIREDMGSEVYAHFPVDAPAPEVEAVEEAIGHEAAVAQAEAARRGGRRFIGRLDRMTRVREGSPIRLAVDTRRLHFFDSKTGHAIY